MINKISIFLLVPISAIFLSGCGNKTSQNGTPASNNVANNAISNSAKPEQTATDTSVTSSSEQGGTAQILNTCKAENVSLPNYGDPGHRLANCFVEYPGEPSRQDKSYYIVEDICGQFSQAFMENMLGSKIAKFEPPQITSLNNCTYYLDDKQNIILNLEYLPIENQKKGNELGGKKVEKNNQISMDNLVVWQDDTLINTIYLVLGPDKFLSLRPSSKDTITKDKFLGLAANIASAIKGYK